MTLYRPSRITPLRSVPDTAARIPWYVVSVRWWLLVLLAFGAILWSGVYIAWHAQDTFGMLLGTGISFLIALQALINIGVVTGTLPNKGIPLPFISYGGSNMVVMLACVGLLLNDARQCDGTERALGRAVSQEDLAAVPLS